MSSEISPLPIRYSVDVHLHDEMPQIVVRRFDRFYVVEIDRVTFFAQNLSQVRAIAPFAEIRDVRHTKSELEEVS
jgi:hypothetical protein